MDTWATSSLSPQVACRWLDEPDLFRRTFPMTVRPNAHDIIRTWDFYTIVKSMYHTGQIPWSDIAISGHGLGPEGEKVSKSRGGGPLGPIEMMTKYSADAVRYWAASTGLGRDSIISEDKIASGQRLVNKLWNAARFALSFLEDYRPPAWRPTLVVTDRWLLSKLQHVTRRATHSYAAYEHVAARDELESFFWSTLTDNYLEMVKARLYQLAAGDERKEAARYALYRVINTLVKLLAPIMPHVTDEVYRLYFADIEGISSIHNAAWPKVVDELVDPVAENIGEMLVAIATEVRRYKSARKLSLGTELSELQVSSTDAGLLGGLREAALDIKSVTRARQVGFSDSPPDGVDPIAGAANVWVLIKADA